MNKKEQEEQQPRFLIHFKECGQHRIVDTTYINPYASNYTRDMGNYHLCIHYFHEKIGRCEISLYHKAADEIPASQSKRKGLQLDEDRTSMPTNHNSDKNNIPITPEERIKINIEYLDWLYAKSREKRKQNKGLLLDTRSAIELVIREAGGENALKELFLEEQDGKIIDELAKSNPKIAEAFKQDWDVGLDALNEFIVNLENNE
jgi:hypothetical protein